MWVSGEAHSWRGNCWCKGPGAGVCPACSEDSKKSRVAAGEGVSGRVVDDEAARLNGTRHTGLLGRGRDTGSRSDGAGSLEGCKAREGHELTYLLEGATVWDVNHRGPG